MRAGHAHLRVSEYRTPRLRSRQLHGRIALTTAGPVDPQQPGGTFTVTVGPDRSATVTRQCFINLASLTGSGTYVTVTRLGTPAVSSNHLKSPPGRRRRASPSVEAPPYEALAVGGFAHMYRIPAVPGSCYTRRRGLSPLP